MTPAAEENLLHQMLESTDLPREVFESQLRKLIELQSLDPEALDIESLRKLAAFYLQEVFVSLKPETQKIEGKK